MSLWKRHTNWRRAAVSANPCVSVALAVFVTLSLLSYFLSATTTTSPASLHPPSSTVVAQQHSNGDELGDAETPSNVEKQEAGTKIVVHRSTDSRKALDIGASGAAVTKEGSSGSGAAAEFIADESKRKNSVDTLTLCSNDNSHRYYSYVEKVIRRSIAAAAQGNPNSLFSNPTNGDAEFLISALLFVKDVFSVPGADSDVSTYLQPPPFLEASTARWIVSEEEEDEEERRRSGNRQSSLTSLTAPLSGTLAAGGGGDAIRYAKATLNAFSVPFPKHLHNTSARMVSLKQYATLSLRSVMTDRRLATLFRAVVLGCGDPRRRRSSQTTIQQKLDFAVSLRNFVDSIVSQIFTTAHLIYETASVAEYRALLHGADDERVGNRSLSVSVQQGLAQWMHRISSPSATSVFHDAFASLVAQQQLQQSASISMSTIYRSRPAGGFFQASPLLEVQPEDLYAPFQPTLRCSAMWRECEHPDACRFACNMEYLQQAHDGDEADEEEGGAPRRRRRRHMHVMIGSGSNNDFMWERNLVRLFRRSASDGNETADTNDNGIRLLATMDCTLRDAPCVRTRFICHQQRVWLPPAFLTKQRGKWGISWLQGSVCLGAHPSAAVTTITSLYSSLLAPALATLPKTQENHLHHNVNETAAADERLSSSGGSIVVGNDLRWYPPQRQLQPQQQSSVTTNSTIAVEVVDSEPQLQEQQQQQQQQELFDDISLLKIDIEEGEYRALGEWLRAKLRRNRNATSFTVSQIQLEVHKTTSKFGSRADIHSKSLWWLEYLRWELASMGFSLVSRDKNHFGRRCYEWVLVHHTFFVRSEMWMMTHHEARI